MRQFEETRLLPYANNALFQLVADIESYPQFLPWCKNVQLSKRSNDRLEAEVTVGFKLVQEKFTTAIDLCPYQRIDVRYIDGPFKHLHTFWTFENLKIPGNANPELTKIHFYMEFQFKSQWLEMLIGGLYHEAQTRIISAFEDRAKQVLI